MRQGHFSSETSKRMVFCAIDGRRYCLDANVVPGLYQGVGVRLNRERSAADGASPLGHLAANHREYPVYALDPRLGAQSRTDLTQCEVVVARSAGEEWGFLVDRSAGMEMLNDERIFSLPPLAQSRAGFFDGAVEANGELVLQLSPSRIRCGAAASGDAGAGVSPPPSCASPAAPSETESPGTSSGRLLVVAVSAENVFFGLSVRQTLEVLGTAKVTPVPGADAHVLGVTLWRSASVPVIDLSVLFGLRPPPPDESARLLMVRGAMNGSAVGICVRPEIVSVKLPMSYRNVHVLERFPTHFAQATFETERGMLIIPNLDGILR
jgi:chemotaxis signal transduction protein